jgi:hypothetical protein
VKSVAVISLALFLSVVFLFSVADDIPPIIIRGSIAVIGFYFGSRN